MSDRMSPATCSYLFFKFFSSFCHGSASKQRFEIDLHHSFSTVHRSLLNASDHGSSRDRRLSRHSIASSSALTGSDSHAYHLLGDAISETSVDDVGPMHAFFTSQGIAAVISGTSMEIPGSAAMRPRAFSFSTTSLAGSLQSGFLPPPSEVTSLLSARQHLPLPSIPVNPHDSDEAFGTSDLLREMKLLSTYAVPIVGQCLFLPF